MEINNNNYSVLEIIQMLDRKDLFVNKDYQRGSGIWPPGPSSYFIETILEKFPFPKIYMYEFLDKEERSVRKEIVDGQQRIGTIVRYVQNEFTLTGDSSFSGKRFNELDDDTQASFFSYNVSVDVIRSATRADILQMFRRMNAFTLPLNEAEKRHSSYQGALKWFINHLADELNETFLEYGVFSNRQIVRMSDAALIADSILAFERGIISSSPRDLRSLYTLYDDHLGKAEAYGSYILEAFDYITANFQDLRKSFMMKPYALHSLITAMIHNRYGIEAINRELNIPSNGKFTHDPVDASRKLVSLAQAHEGKEIEGPHSHYVWGCSSTTDRKARRTARVASILKALGANVSDQVYDNLA